MDSGCGESDNARWRDAQEPSPGPRSRLVRDSRAVIVACNWGCSGRSSKGYDADIFCVRGWWGRFKAFGCCVKIARVAKTATLALVRLAALLAVAHPVMTPLNSTVSIPGCATLLAFVILAETCLALAGCDFGGSAWKGGQILEMTLGPDHDLGTNCSTSVQRSPDLTEAARRVRAAKLEGCQKVGVSSTVLWRRLRVSGDKVPEVRAPRRRDQSPHALLALEDSKSGDLKRRGSATSSPSLRRAAGAAASATLVAGVLAHAGVASGQVANDYVGVITVPLIPSGFQYSVNVTVSKAIYNATAALIVDTALDIVGFPFCSDDLEHEGENDMYCIPYEATKLGEDFTYPCQEILRDDGAIFLHAFDPQEPSQMKYLNNQLVELRNSSLGANSDSSSYSILSASGSILTISNQAAGDDSTLQGWNSTRGVFGLAPYSHPLCFANDSPTSSGFSSVFWSMLANIPESLEPIFALNLNDEDSVSTLEIGGHTAASNEDWGDLVWGERHTAKYPSAWGFPAFDLSVCGRGLFGNITSSWPAILSTGSACLGLPQEMFDNLMAWLPCGTLEKSVAHWVCYIDQDTIASAGLPWLSFRLSEGGTTLYIPLGSLVLNEGPSDDPNSSEKRLCVTRGGSMFDDDDQFKMPDNQSMITLGTLPLRSLYAVADSSSRRVGLAQKLVETLSGEEDSQTCEAPAVCVGMQTFKESSNSCEDPICSKYFFASLDEETMSCRSSRRLTLLALAVGITFSLTEMVAHFLRAYYGGTGLALRGQPQHHGWEFHVGRVIDAGISKATRAIGVFPRRRDD